MTAKIRNAIGGAIAGLAALIIVIAIFLTGKTSLPESLSTNTTDPNASGDLTSACGLYIDGKLFAPIKNGTDAEAVLDSIKKAKTADLQVGENAFVGFVQKVDLAPGFYPAEQLVDAQTLLRMLTAPGREKTLEIKITQIETRLEEVPFETVDTENHDLFRGEIRVRMKGVPGQDKITERVTYVNGMCVGEPEIISRTRVAESVTERREIGTKDYIKP